MQVLKNSVDIYTDLTQTCRYKITMAIIPLEVLVCCINDTVHLNLIFFMNNLLPMKFKKPCTVHTLI